MTTTNLLVAIKNIVTNPITNLTGHYNSSSNRVNSEGEALENYIKDIFCGTVNTTDENQRNQIFSQHFSYLGNQNNPPDIMIRGGDAIEVKKMESNGSGIALNSIPTPQAGKAFLKKQGAISTLLVNSPSALSRFALKRRMTAPT